MNSTDDVMKLFCFHSYVIRMYMINERKSKPPLQLQRFVQSIMRQNLLQKYKHSTRPKKMEEYTYRVARMLESDLPPLLLWSGSDGMENEKYLVTRRQSCHSVASRAKHGHHWDYEMITLCRHNLFCIIQHINYACRHHRNSISIRQNQSDEQLRKRFGSVCE